MRRFKNTLLALSPKTDGAAAITRAVKLASNNLTIAEVDQITSEQGAALNARRRTPSRTSISG